jgi:hypothetical protein
MTFRRQLLFAVPIRMRFISGALAGHRQGQVLGLGENPRWRADLVKSGFS